MKVILEQKNQTIQIMRGLAITIVLIRHAIAQVNTDAILGAAEQIIICFHMPVFFMIAGYLFQSGFKRYLVKGKSLFLRDKAKHLLIPYAFWTIFLWGGGQVACMISPSVLSKLSEIGFAPMSVGNLVYGLLTYQVYYTEHLWFLYVLFLMFTINIILEQHGASSYAVGVWILVGLCSSFVDFPHIIERTMVWGAFFSAGRLINKYEFGQKNEKPNLNCQIIVGFIFILGCILRVIGLNMGMPGKALTILIQVNKYIVGFAGVYLIYVLSVYLNKRKIGHFIKIIGDYSFDVYLMHNPYFCALSAMVLNKMVGLNSYFSVVIAAAVGAIIPMAVSSLIVRKLKVLSMIMIGK